MRSMCEYVWIRNGRRRREGGSLIVNKDGRSGDDE